VRDRTLHRGTADVHVQVATGQPTATPTAFKVTGRCVMTPGPDMAEQ